MRLWHISYEYLDDARLTAQHHELHAIATMVTKGVKWGTITDEFKDQWRYLEIVHKKAWDEMCIRRGYQKNIPYTTLLNDHKTPLERPTGAQSGAFKPTTAHLKLDVISLREKWEVEGYYFGVGRSNLRGMEGELGLPVGKSSAECVEIHKETRSVVRTHRGILSKLSGRMGWKLKVLRENNLVLDPDRLKDYQRRVNVLDREFRESMKSKVAELALPVTA